MGRVQNLFRAPKKRLPMEELAEVQAVADAGFEGCAHAPAGAQALVFRKVFRWNRRGGSLRPPTRGTTCPGVPIALCAARGGWPPSDRKACKPR